MNERFNQFQFTRQDIFLPFYKKWRDKETLTIAHFGDSHIQAGTFTGKVRELLKSDVSSGGRGLIFPFSIAKTYSPADYTSRHHGKWQAARSLEYRPKFPLGITGITARTFDPEASFRITFRETVPAQFRRLRLFIKRGPASFDLIIKCAGGEVAVPGGIQPGSTNNPEVELPVVGDFIEVRMARSSPDQKEFELYGLSLEDVRANGLIYHSLGIGGAQFRSVLNMTFFAEQLAAIAPDLVILDFGTNDHLYQNTVPADMDSVIVRAVKRVRAAVPYAAILLTSTQDMNYRGFNVSSGRLYSALVRKIAVEQDCAFYDWYWISGGPGAMSWWDNHRLAQPDNVHLSPAGYAMKGELFYKAFQSMIRSMAAGGSSVMLRPDSLTYDQLAVRQDSVLAARQKGASADHLLEKGRNIYLHKIKPGESLSTIARKYGVSVAELQRWNGIQGSKIIAGKSLRILLKPGSPQRPR